MSVTRDFDAMMAEKLGDRPTFKVAGQTFTLRAKIPFAKWSALIAMMRSDDIDAMEASRIFFDRCLIKDDRERFRALLDDDTDEEDDDKVLGLEDANALTDWAMEHFTGKTPEQFAWLLAWCRRNWGVAERCLLESPQYRQLTVRQACLLMWEAMVAEMRAVRAEADARRHFTEDKKPIELVRDQLSDWTEVRPAQDPALVAARSAAALHTAAADDLFEVG